MARKFYEISPEVRAGVVSRYLEGKSMKESVLPYGYSDRLCARILKEAGISPRSRGDRQSYKPTFGKSKECRICKKVKPLSDFRESKDTLDGHSSWCKDCNKEYQRQWAARVRASSPDEISKRRKSNREYQRRVCATPEGRTKKKQAQKQRYEAIKHTDEFKLSRRLTSALRRSRKKGVSTEKFMKKDWQAILSNFDNQCAYCGASDVKLEQEHVIPLSRKGPHSKDNIVPACRSCNAQKYDRLPEEAGMKNPLNNGTVCPTLNLKTQTGCVVSL